MTPLAHRIVRELTLQKKKRIFRDESGILDDIRSAHFFECTKVAELAFEFGRNCVFDGRFTKTQTFLPAPATWIEFVPPTGERFAVLLTEHKIGAKLRIAFSGTFKSPPWAMFIDLEGCASEGRFVRALSKSVEELPTGRQKDAEFALEWASTVALGCIAMINTPRHFGRIQHEPHRGLERELLKHAKAIGSYPLQAWNEIVLKVDYPDAPESGDHIAHLTGRKALEFVRAHLRCQNGVIVVVRPYWRGDPALGIRRSRYLVTQ